MARKREDKNPVPPESRPEMRIWAILGSLVLALALAAGIIVFFSIDSARKERLKQAAEEAEAAAKARIALEARKEEAKAAEGAAKAVEAIPKEETGEKTAGAPEEPAGGGALSGTVRIAGTKDPAPGVQVVLRREAPDEKDFDLQKQFEPPKILDGDLWAASGADGGYRIRGIQPGDYRVFALRGDRDFASILPRHGKTVSFEAGIDETAMDIEVSLGGVIRGKVLDHEGNPIAGASVSAPAADFLSSIFDPDSPFQGFGEVKSKDDGTYRITGLPLDKRLILLASAQDRTRFVSKELAFEEGSREIEYDVVLLPGSVVSGRVVGEQGQPIEGAAAKLRKAETKSIFEMDDRFEGIQTDAQGAFEFKKVPAGNFILTAEKEGRKAEKEIPCDGMSPVPDLTLVLQGSPTGETFTLSGRVVDAGGTALPGAKISLQGAVPLKGPYQANATSQADGTFTIQDVPQGVLILQASLDGFTNFLKAGLDPKQGPLEIVLQRLAKVSGIVVSRSSGEPLAGAVVRLAPISEGFDGLQQLMVGQMPGSMPTAKTGADGTFLLEKVSPGRARIRGEASKLAPGFSKVLEIAPAQEVGGVKVELSEGGGVEGIVLGPDGKPAADATVRAMELAENLLENQMRKLMPNILGAGKPPSAKTEEDGLFRIRYLPEGKFTLTAVHPDLAPSADQEVSLGPDELRQGLQLRLRPPSTVRIVVREKDKPLPGLMVQLVGPGPMKMSSTDLDGKVEFIGIPPGAYLVQVIDMQKMMSGQVLGMPQKVVRIAEGENKDFPIILGVGAKVRGKISGTLPAPMLLVVVHRPEAPKAEEMDNADLLNNIEAAEHNVGTTVVNPDGTYVVDDVPDGDFIVEVPRMPTDYLKAMQMKPEERKPFYRSRDVIKVRDGKDVEHNIPRLDEAPAPPAPPDGR